MSSNSVKTNYVESANKKNSRTTHQGEVQTYSIPVIEKANQDFKFLDFSKKEDSFLIAKEASNSLKNEFEIDDVVSKNRGHFQYELDQKELAISNEVELRLKDAYEESKKKGHEDGLLISRREINANMAAEVKRKINDVETMVEEILSLRDKIIEESYQDLFRTINSIAKWILHKQLDKDSIMELMKRTFHEIGTNQNILIKMDQETYTHKDEILQKLVNEFGELKHIRFLCDETQLRPGYQVEMDNMLIDATFESQMKRIDLIFNKLGERKNEEIS